MVELIAGEETLRADLETMVWLEKLHRSSEDEGIITETRW
jgi:hypothetical protein